MKHINKINLSQGKVNHNRFNDYSRYGKQYSDKSYINNQSNDIKNNNPQNFGSHINSDKSNYKAAVYSRNVSHKYSSRTIKYKKNKKKKNFFIKFGVAIIVLIVIGIGVYKFFPIKITINGLEQTLTYDKSVSQAINQSQLSVAPGNFIAVDYSILKAGEGEEFNIKINGDKITNLDYKLSNGDIIEYNNGDDIMEECKSVDSNIIAKSKIIGVGAVHKFSGTGESGTWSKLTGTVSGKYAERTTKEPNNVTCKNVNINPGSDKVIALTFDDGPSEEYTQQILDILDRYKAKATFFVIGENLEEEWGKKLVAKEDSKGHQVCTHTYDHARAAGGVDITVMSAEKQIEEVTKGQMMISEALGKSASTVVRLPGGNLNAITVRLIAKYVSAEIGWNIDTTDWQKPGTDVISYKLSKASSGNVILCHDGGGDRSQTVEAIEDFIKKYTDKGYKFVTIDELMNYQEATDEDSNKIIDTDNDGTSSKSNSNNSYSNSYDSSSNTDQYGYNNNYYESRNNSYGAY